MQSGDRVRTCTAQCISGDAVVKLLQACRESEDEKAEGSYRLQKQSGFRCLQRIVLKGNAAKIQKAGFQGSSSVSLNWSIATKKGLSLGRTELLRGLWCRLGALGCRLYGRSDRGFRVNAQHSSFILPYGSLPITMILLERRKSHE